MKTMITGVRPTGSITLANYIGGIRKFIEQQNEYNSLQTVDEYVQRSFNKQKNLIQ